MGYLSLALTLVILYLIARTPSRESIQRSILASMVITEASEEERAVLALNTAESAALTNDILHRLEKKGLLKEAL